MNPNVRHDVKLLGYAGLVPFVGAVLVALLSPDYAAPAHHVASVYAFGIVTFLTGSWWGLALRSGSRRLLLLSNLYFLVAFISYAFAADWWPLAAAILLMATFFAEQNLVELGKAYRRLRNLLAAVAAVSMLALHFGP